MRIKYSINKYNLFNEMSFIDFIIPLYGIFSYYPLPGVSTVGMAVMYIYTLSRICKSALLGDGMEIPLNKYIFWFTIYALISQPFIFIMYGGFNLSRLFNILSIPMMVAVISINFKDIHIHKMFHWYFVIAVICSIAIIYQAFLLYGLGKLVYPIKLLPVNTSAWFDGGTRPVGFFPEPQAFATFILPLLYYELKMQHIKKSVFLIFAIICSTSSLGIMGTLILIFFYLLSKETKMWVKIVTIIGGALILILMSNTSLFEYAVTKIAGIDIFNNSRLSHGFDVYAPLSTMQKIFGIGKNNIQYFLQSGHIILLDYVSIAMRNAAYVTSVADTLICFGIVGVAIILLFFVRHLIHSSNRPFLFLLLVLSFAQTIFLNSPWILYMLIYFSIIKTSKRDFYFIRFVRKA